MLESSRVALRPVEKTHLPQFTAWFSSYELVRLMAPGAIKLVNQEAEAAWFEGVCASTNSYVYAIFAIDDPHHPDGRLLGSCSLFEVDGKNRSATFGIAIADPTARGKGYGGEALDLLIEFGFLELNLNRIQLLVYAFNERAVHLYGRKGFVVEGRLRQAIFREGRAWDTLVMGLLSEDYTPREGWGLE